MALGDELLRLRTAAGLSQRALAATCGVAHTYIAQLESGARSGLTADMLFNLSRALGVGCEHWQPFFGGNVPAVDPPAPKPRGRPKKAQPDTSAPAASPALAPTAEPGKKSQKKASE